MRTVQGLQKDVIMRALRTSLLLVQQTPRYTGSSLTVLVPVIHLPAVFLSTPATILQYTLSKSSAPVITR